jgi:hypothetical protein
MCQSLALRTVPVVLDKSENIILRTQAIFGISGEE